MLVQYLNIRSEKNQHFLMICMFLVFIFYSLYTSFNISLWLVSPLILMSVVGVVLLMRRQIKNRTVVQLQVYFKADKRKVLKRNINWVLYPFLIYSLLTFIHFYVVFISGKSLMPLIYDYGIGGLLALLFTFFMLRKWNYGVCNEGIVIGSKFDSKLIVWENIDKVNYGEGKIEIIFRKQFPIQYLVFENVEEVMVLKKLLSYKFSS